MKKFLVSLLLVTCGVGCFFAASCGKAEYKYSFQTNGGTEIATIIKEEGEEFDLPTPEGREGYAFAGWYTTEDFSGDPVGHVKAEGNTTFYAKWEQLEAITLELNGGSLDGVTKLYLKKGEVVYDFMSGYVPAKTGYEFGAWFVGGTELTKNQRMPEGGLTLTAKYKVGYTVEVYKQNKTLDGYDRDEVKTYYDYVGTVCEADEKFTGFSEADNSAAVTRITLTENASANVLKVYFDRNDVILTLNPNYPDGAEGSAKTIRTKYGLEVELPADLLTDGYLLAGWAASRNGDAEYKVDSIGSNLFNKDTAEAPEADTYTAERSIQLFAVWYKGYTDMFGGKDSIFLLDDEIYLLRGGVFFKGDYNADKKTFSFINDVTNDIVVRGKIVTDDRYAYISETRKNNFTYFTVGGGFDNNIQLRVDDYNGISYVVTDENERQSTSKGTYVIDEDGLYIAEFTEGELNGKTLTIMLVTVTSDNNQQTPAFIVRNEEEYAIGPLVCGVVMKDYGLTYYTNGILNLTLSGFGTATLFDGSENQSYYYIFDNTKASPEITLINSDGQQEGVVRMMTINGAKGYLFYYEDLDTTFTTESGEKLTLDGLCNATYTGADGKKVSGYYMARGSVFGGTLITVLGNPTVTYLLTSTTTTTGEGDDAVETTEYEIATKTADYAEYYYKDADGVSQAPLVVMNEPEMGKATIYGYASEEKTYKKVSVGSYTLNEKTKTYLYTAEQYFECEGISTKPVGDLSGIAAFEFALGTVQSSSSGSYSVNYWYSSTLKEGETERYDTVYTSAATNGELTFVGGFAILDENGKTVAASYTADSSNPNLIKINSSDSVYVLIDEESKTFKTLETPPYTAQAIKADGYSSDKITLAFDGLGGAVYTDATDKDNPVTYTGTYTNTKETLSNGYYIFTFTSEGLTFRFIQLSTSDGTYFIRYNEEIEKDYASGDGVLKLDGFCFGTYTSTSGAIYEGMYFVDGDGVLGFVAEDASFYFDTDGASFTVRGGEYGTYVIMDNQNVVGVLVTLDGYGKAQVYKNEPVDGEMQKVDIDADASYSEQDGVYTLTYKEGEKSVTLVGRLSTFTYNSNNYNIFVICHDEAAKTLVNVKDWSTLILDDTGNVTKYGKDGAEESGSYTLVTDKLLYYVNDEGTDAGLFNYDFAKGTATPIDYLTARSYYTEDLNALLFSKYGDAVFNGETYCYYNVENGKVVIYRQDATNPNANKYGYYEDRDTIKSFGDTIVFENETYYKNDGYNINFSRQEDNKDKYPIKQQSGAELSLETLTFTPPGTKEFVASGKVTLGGTTSNCYVIRKEVEEGVYETYISLGYYRFYVNLKYGANSGSYEITDMKYVVELPSYAYLYYYYYAYLYYGQSAANSLENTFGEVSFITEFNEEGEETDDYVIGWFGKNSGMVGVDGEIVSFERGTYKNQYNLSTIEFEATDGYHYQLVLYVDSSDILAQYFGAIGYQVYAFSRVETLTDEASGYTIKIGRVITSDQESMTTGTISSISLFKGEDEIKSEGYGLFGDDWCLVVTTGEGDERKTTYYKFVLKEAEDVSVGENKVPVYESVTVTEMAVTRYYAADEKSYVDIDADGNVRLIHDGTNGYIMSQTSYDESTKTYTASTKSGKTYTVKVEDDGTVTITEVVEE